MRSVSAEPAYRSNILKQADKFETSSNARNESIKKSNDLKSYRNSINVGKVADKFEKKLDKSEQITPTKRNFSLSNQKSPLVKGTEGIEKSPLPKQTDLSHEDAKRPNVVSSPRRSAFSPNLEDKIRKLEAGEDERKANKEKKDKDLARKSAEISEAHSNRVPPQMPSNNQKKELERQASLRSQSNFVKSVTKPSESRKDPEADHRIRNREQATTNNTKCVTDHEIVRIEENVLIDNAAGYCVNRENQNLLQTELSKRKFFLPLSQPFSIFVRGMFSM